jgi:hypothetical protein
VDSFAVLNFAIGMADADEIKSSAAQVAISAAIASFISILP